MRRTLPSLLAGQAITPERAWWLGVLLGDGNVYQTRSNARVTVVGALSTVSRWLALVAPDKEPKEIKRCPGTYQGYVDSKVLVEHMRATYGLGGPKTHTLPWLEVPDDVRVHYLRGLWDTDGELSIERRPKGKGNDSPKARFGVAPKPFVLRASEALTEACGARAAAARLEKGVWRISYAGRSAMQVADYLYGGAPEHLRNEDRYGVYQQMVALREQLELAECERCGAPAQREGYCVRCWYALRKRACACGKFPTKALGMCQACYSRHLRSLPGYVRRSTGTCSCGEPAFRRGLCDACYSRERRAVRAE